MTYLPANARSECVGIRTPGSPYCLSPSDLPPGGRVAIIFMFQAASPASHHPAFSPTRGSGFGAVAETIGFTGFGIVDGGVGGGGGGVPPRPPAAPPPGAAAAGAAPAGCADGAAAGGVAAGCAAAGGGVAGAAAGGGALGVVAGGAALLDELAHAAMKAVPPASSPAAKTPAVRRARGRERGNVIGVTSYELANS